VLPSALENTVLLVPSVLAAVPVGLPLLLSLSLTTTPDRTPLYHFCSTPEILPAVDTMLLTVVPV
jgi:hypothetical protein